MNAQGAVQTDEARRRLVPCGGHAFDENLVCRCHMSWWTHQQRPRTCPMDARRHNCHAPEDEHGPV